MTLTATEAKNRFGQVLEQAQKRPVVIHKAGRRHSVVMSAEHYDSLPAAGQAAANGEPGVAGRQFYEKYRDWVDEQNAHFEAHGIWNEELRAW